MSSLLNSFKAIFLGSFLDVWWKTDFPIIIFVVLQNIFEATPCLLSCIIRFKNGVEKVIRDDSIDPLESYNIKTIKKFQIDFLLRRDDVVNKLISTRRDFKKFFLRRIFHVSTFSVIVIDEKEDEKEDFLKDGCSTKIGQRKEIGTTRAFEEEENREKEEHMLR